jgi:hypothetical protein
MPDTNDVCLTKAEARDGLLLLANEWRDDIAIARSEGQRPYPRITGNLRDAFYEVEASEYTSYHLSIETCCEPECLDDIDE